MPFSPPLLLPQCLLHTPAPLPLLLPSCPVEAVPAMLCLLWFLSPMLLQYSSVSSLPLLQSLSLCVSPIPIPRT